MDNQNPFMTTDENEKIFIAEVDAALSTLNFAQLQTKNMVRNDMIIRNRQSKILEPLQGFIQKEYSLFLTSKDAEFKSKEEVYNHLVSLGKKPLTKEFSDEYAKLCRDSKLI